MRKITSLFKAGVRVYLLISDKETDTRFRRQAKQEGVKILGENGLYIFRDKQTLSSVGFVDHVCFGSDVSHMGDGMPIVRIDVEKYFSESQDYLYRKQ
jgi:hypothetical protein